MTGRIELMNSRLSGSEKALATLACARLSSRQSPRILIGGLGMGFTLRAALGALGPDAKIMVTELVPAVIAWARGPLAAIMQGCLEDTRVTMCEGDVAGSIAEGRSKFDAILLDVDNGPDGLTAVANDLLYGASGLGASYRALRPGGVLAVWSSGPDKGFVRRLFDAGFAVDERRVRAHEGRRGARHVIWLATPAGRTSTKVII